MLMTLNMRSFGIYKIQLAQVNTFRCWLVLRGVKTLSAREGAEKMLLILQIF